MEATFCEEATISTIMLKIDFGPGIGLKTSRTQITKRHKAEEMTGRKVLGIMNFPSLREAGYNSDVIVLGGIQEIGDVVLLKPDIGYPPG